ncbi:MAG: hypothetical protein A2Y79_02945 [Deltaproteobacteria bacterium RBG_13_43_22]|jgi:hypothetical protein|nr:MAG: hypothetical protein A2Y79_02945 [Deltaproteobacteria bacterium RBG_13_43_22]
MTKDSIKLVHCVLSKKKGTKKKAEARFIPYQEFELWKYFISHQYEVTVSEEDIYLWIPQKEFERKKASFVHVEWLPVHKITLYFFLKNEGVLVPVTRFFQESDYPKVKPLFLKHFEEFQDEGHMTKVLEHIQEEKGVCLKNI